MSDVDIVLEVATKGIENVYNLSNAMKQLNLALNGAVNPIKAYDARAKALSTAVGATNAALNNHAKTIQQVARNQAVLSSEMGRVRKELEFLNKGYTAASGVSAKFAERGIKDLQNYEKALKHVKFGALAADLKSVAIEQKRLGKDAQFVGRSLIIGLTTPIMGFARYGLQALVGLDREFVRLNKVLESISPNLEDAANKMGINLKGATDAQIKSLQTLVDNYNKLDQSLSGISSKFGTSKELVVSLAGEFAELGIQSTEGIAKITELTTATEKLGNMDIGNARQLVQSLYFQAVRAMQQSGESRNMTAMEKETAAIAAAKSQLALFNAVENTTALTLKDLGASFPEVAAAATTFGLSMTEATALLAPMKAAGMEVGASANAIKISLQSIVSPTKKTEQMFESLTNQYGEHFKLIKGTGLDAIQALIDAYQTLEKSSAGQEGVLQFFEEIFGKRQSTRMLVGIQQLAEMDSVLKDNSVSAARAEKQIQAMANSAIVSANKASGANLPLVDSYKSIGVIARVATATAGQAVEGFSKKVSQSQIDAAIKVRDEISKGIFKKSQKEGIDLIGQVATESGRAMFIELAGVKNAQGVADRELDRSLKSLEVTIQRMKNGFKMFAADMLTAIRPALEKVSAFVTKLYDAWTKLDPATKSAIAKLTVGIGAVTAAIGPLIFMFGQFRLAMGSVASVVFSFLPSLKTMTVEMVAANSKMLNLTKPLVVMGETVSNTSGKFATFIATLASGSGPIATFAEKVGITTGVLQKQTTATFALTAAVNEMKTAKAGLGGIGTGLIGFESPIEGVRGLGPGGRTTDEVERGLRKRALRAAGFSGVSKGATGKTTITKGILTDMLKTSGYDVSGVKPTYSNLYKEVAEQKFEALGLGTKTGRRPTPGGGPGVFTRKTADILAEAEDLQSRGFTSASGRGPRGRFMAKAVRDALKSLEDAQAEVTATMDSAGLLAKDIIKTAKADADAAFDKARKLAKKGVDFDPLTRKGTFKGRILSDERLSAIESGGFKSLFARTAEGGERFKARSILFGKKGLDLTEKASGKFIGGETTFNAIKSGVKGVGEFVKNPIQGIKDMGTAIVGLGPKFMGFMKSPSTMLPKIAGMFTKLGTVVTGLLPSLSSMGSMLAFTGVGAAIAGVIAVIIIVVKHWKEFHKAIQPGIKAFKEAFDIIKQGVMDAIQPIIKFFQTFTNDGDTANGVIVALSYAFNFLAEAVKFVAKIISWLLKNVVGGAFSMALKPIVAMIKGVISFISGIVEIFHGNFSKGFHKIVDGIGKVIVGLMGPFAGLFSGILKMIAKVMDAMSHIPFVGGIFKKAGDGLRAVAGYIDKARELGKKGAEAGAKKVTPDPDTRPMQEKMTNSVGTGITKGVDKGAEALNKLNKKLSAELKREVQDDIADRIKGAMANVVTSLTDALKGQKEQSLKIYDDQLKKIEETSKAEERLTKTKEYENKKRELEEKRALDRLNSQRNYNLAIYEGRIDDARQISLEGQKAELDAQKEMADIESSRKKELADQRKEDLVASIKDARDVASKYYDDMITSFTDAAKKITEFPPTTAEKFNEQLKSLTDKAKELAGNIGTKTTEGFTGALATLGVDATGPLTSALGTISDVLVKNSPFGPDGIWQKTIDESLVALKQKYEGLTDTLTMVIDKNSSKFKDLFETYKKYKELVAKNEAELAGTSGGGGGTGSSTGKTGGNVGQTGVDYNPGWYYHYKEKGQKFWSPWQGPLDKATIDRLQPVYEKIGIFSAQFSNYNPGTTTFGVTQGTAANALYGRNAFAIGGVIPYGQGGPTKGPVQQGIPAILHGGEYVVRNSAVKKYGWGMMQQINQGTFKPRPFANGGMIDKGGVGGENVQSDIDSYPDAPLYPTPKKGFIEKKITGYNPYDTNFQFFTRRKLNKQIFLENIISDQYRVAKGSLFYGLSPSYIFDKENGLIRTSIGKHNYSWLFLTDQGAKNQAIIDYAITVSKMAFKKMLPIAAFSKQYLNPKKLTPIEQIPKSPSFTFQAYTRNDDEYVDDSKLSQDEIIKENAKLFGINKKFKKINFGIVTNTYPFSNLNQELTKEIIKPSESRQLTKKITQAIKNFHTLTGIPYAIHQGLLTTPGKQFKEKNELGVNIVPFSQKFGDPYGHDVLADTAAFFNNIAEIRYNTVDEVSDLVRTMTHELGHVIGLYHTHQNLDQSSKYPFLNDENESLMSYYAEWSDNLQTYGAGDIAYIQALRKAIGIKNTIEKTIPKRFNGGMIDKARTTTNDTAAEIAEFSRQANKLGGFSEYFWNMVQPRESAFGWSEDADKVGYTLPGKGRKARNPKTGGLSINNRSWEAYGGQLLNGNPLTAGQATPLQQMIIANRMAVLGWDNPITGKTIKNSVGLGGWSSIQKPLIGKTMNLPGYDERPGAMINPLDMSAKERAKIFLSGEDKFRKRQIYLMKHPEKVFNGGLIEYAKGGIVDESRKNTIGLKNVKKKKNGIFNFVDKVGSTVVNGIMNTAATGLDKFGHIVYSGAESMAASTTNPLGKALHLPGFKNARVAGPLEGAINAAFLAYDVATAGGAEPFREAALLSMGIRGAERDAIMMAPKTALPKNVFGAESAYLKSQRASKIRQNVLNNIKISQGIREASQLGKFYGNKNELSILVRGIDLHNILESGVIDSSLSKSSGYISNKSFLKELGLSHSGYSEYGAIRDRMQAATGVLRGNKNYGLIRRADDFTVGSQYTSFHLNIQEAGELFGSAKGASSWAFQRQMDDLLGNVWIDLVPNPKMTYTVGDSYNMFLRGTRGGMREEGYAYLDELTKAKYIPHDLNSVPIATIGRENIIPSHGAYTELQFPRIPVNNKTIKAITIIRDFDWESLSPMELFNRVSGLRGEKVIGWGAEEKYFVGLQEMLVHQRELAKKAISMGLEVRTGVPAYGNVPTGYGNTIFARIAPKIDKISLGAMSDNEFKAMLMEIKVKLATGRDLLAERERYYARGDNRPRVFNGGLIPKFANGGIVPGFDSMGIPSILHGGEYVINSKAVKNIGFAALEAMNNMRFQTPKAPSYNGGVSGQATSSSTVHIYVDNFIGEKAWFESMMKDYNINVGPQKQKAAGLQNRTITTYNGINRGL